MFDGKTCLLFMLLTTSGLCSASDELQGGDRHPQLNCIYPDDVFMDNGGNVIDVTKPPYNAKGDGKTDDTNALIRAYDYVISQFDKYGWKEDSELNTCVIYLPNGEYLVSNTIIYSRPLRMDEIVPVSEALVRLRIIGQSRENTIIRLKDSCPGFGEGAGKPVVSYGKGRFNNLTTTNAFRNITINTGSGNPGAVGLDFAGANNTGIHNVTIKSEDGLGSMGLHIRICPTMGYHNNITIKGFDYGICMTPYHVTHNSFEHITLTGQKKAGIKLVDSTTSIRDLRFTGSAPAIQHIGKGSHAVVIDSEFTCEKPEVPAIDLQKGHLFARNVRLSGFACAVYRDEKPVVSGDYIDEYVSGPVYAFSKDQVKRSIGLPIEETPSIPWEQDPEQWASVDIYGAKGDGVVDDTDAIQAAMNSGKPVVYFPKRVYAVKGTVKVPATVKRVNFVYANIDGSNGDPGPMFEINEDSADPIIFEDGGMNGGLLFEHKSPRTVIFSHIATSSLFYRNTNPGSNVKLFVNNCMGFGKPGGRVANQKVWCRFINTEFPGRANFIIAEGGTMWVFGYKCEKGRINFEATDGSALEVLGGVANQFGEKYFDPPMPIVRNENSHVSYVGCTNGPSKDHGFEYIIEEIRGEDVEKIKWDEFPRRVGRKHQIVIPLYVGYDPDSTDNSGAR